MKKNKSNKAYKRWVIFLTSIAFIISLIMSVITELIIPNAFLVISIILVLLFIFIGIVFDIIGVAVTTADDKIFHSMASRKVKGSKTAIYLINNKEKVSSFCNDVIGDICGVISGSAGLGIAIKISSVLNINQAITTIIITSLISALTIGGKALGKKIAVEKNNAIVNNVIKVLSIFKKDRK